MDGYVDLDLLSISLKDMQEPWEGMRRRQAFQRFNNGGERGESLLKCCENRWGRKPLFICTLEKVAVGRNKSRCSAEVKPAVKPVKTGLATGLEAEPTGRETGQDRPGDRAGG